MALNFVRWHNPKKSQNSEERCATSYYFMFALHLPVNMRSGLLAKELVTSQSVANPLQMFYQVNVTADHRIIYGADLAAFLQTFAKIIENPDGLTM